MQSRDIERLRRLTDFEALVDYLRDELDWPIEVEDAEDITFEYDPAELGLDPQHAAKIETLKQVRPLVDDQPWGVFYLAFETKRLPVVVLRRILRGLVPRSRDRSADQPVWQLEDLLFISTFGDAGPDRREIAFAHFHQGQEAGDLPTLRVLGWDGADTPLKLDHVAATLKAHLCWPTDPADADAWREQWTRAFRHRLGHVIRTADALADRLATLARAIRDAATTLMALEAEHGPLRRLHAAFQTALIHDLSAADFADTYAQTITYGLLTAAIQRTPPDGGRYDTTLYPDMLAEVIPITNPFLREMLQTFLHVGGRQGGIDFDELGIQDVVDLLRSDTTDMPAILRDFGNRAPGEDPVIHFYEHFLSAYNKQLKVQRGVFYTPQPVVSYIVRSVHELLQTEFGLEDGLASTVTWGELRMTSDELQIPDGVDPDTPFVQILDPATGTATFLVEVIEVIYQTLTAKWTAQELTEAQQRAAWNEYVPAHLLPRMYGYELMMAPYAIAHMKIGLKLTETGFSAWPTLGDEDRVRIYLTNALEPATGDDRQMAFAELVPALAHEARAVNEVKRRQWFTVVVGNPPYSKFSVNNGAWISELMETYKSTVRSEEVQIQGLSDDYVKFIRFAHYQVAKTGCGIAGIITNSGYLDGPLFRDLRTVLLRDFSTIWIVNLEGDSRKRAISDNNVQDENVFEIQQGVSIAILIHKLEPAISSGILYQNIVGLRAKKYDFLYETNILTRSWITIKPKAPNNIFIPRSSQGSAEWDSAWDLQEVFKGGVRSGRALPFSGAGFATRHDLFAVAFSTDELLDNIREFLNPALTESQLRKRFHLCTTAHWSFHKARQHLTVELAREKLTRFLYRPFDWRFTCYTDLVIGEMRPDIMMNLLHPNIALVTTRRSTGRKFDNFLVSDTLVEYKAGTHDRNTQVFPLYLYTNKENAQYTFLDVSTSTDQGTRRPNLGLEFISDIEDHLNLGFVTDGRGDLCQTFGPEDVLHYAYAVFHSPTYRTRYAEFLKIDFPRLPLTSDAGLFRALVGLGADLVALHLLEEKPPAGSEPAGGSAGSPLQRPITTFVERETGATMGAFSKSKCYSPDDGRVYLDTSNRARSSYFEGVPEEVWQFQIGGYQVLYKWLYDRRGTKGEPGRTLTPEEIAHYQRVVVALRETMRLMDEIDETIDAHGGWPIE